jgi:hypothetical protein
MKTKIWCDLQLIRVKASPIISAVEKVMQYDQIVHMARAILGREIWQKPYQYNVGSKQNKVTHNIAAD